MYSNAGKKLKLIYILMLERLLKYRSGSLLRCGEYQNDNFEMLHNLSNISELLPSHGWRSVAHNVEGFSEVRAFCVPSSSANRC